MQLTIWSEGASCQIVSIHHPFKLCHHPPNSPSYSRSPSQNQLSDRASSGPEINLRAPADPARSARIRHESVKRRRGEWTDKYHPHLDDIHLYTVLHELSPWRVIKQYRDSSWYLLFFVKSSQRTYPHKTAWGRANNMAPRSIRRFESGWFLWPLT